MIKIKKDERTSIGRWFAMADEGVYIHKDGSVGPTVYNTQHGFTGRYTSREQARAAVRLYRTLAEKVNHD